MTEFNPLAIAGSEALVELPGIGHNNPPELPQVALFTEIDDLYDEARNFADGEPIDSEALHDAMTELRDRLHKAGVAAEALRKEAVKPHDDAKAEIQATFNPYVKDKTGKVALGKSAIDTLTGAWRKKVADEKAAEAKRIADEAAKATAAADAAIQASSGNLAAREDAESLLQDAKRLEKTAARTWKAATVGTRLRTTWVAVLEDEEKAMDWTWERAKDELLAVAQANADAAVRGGLRAVPGFRVEERKVAN